MAEVTDIELLRKRRRRKIFWHRLLKSMVFILVIMAFAVGVFCFFRFDGVRWVEEQVAAFTSGSGYPLEFAGDTLVDIQPVGKNVALLTDTSFYLYNRSASQMANVQHNFHTPVMDVEGNRILLYDRGAQKLTVYDKSREIYSKDFDYPIISAALSDRGTLLVITETQRYIAEVTVFDKLGGQLFKWYSSKNYVLGADFFSGGDSFGVMALNGVEGDISSTVSFFFVHNTEEEALFATHDYTGSLLVDLHSKSGGSMTAVFTDQVVAYDKAGQETGRYHLDSQILSSYNNEPDNYTLLLLGDYASLKSNDLLVLDQQAQQVCSIQLTQQVLQVEADDERIYCIGEETVWVYDYTGALLGETQVNTEILRARLIGGQLYAVTISDVRLLELNIANG